MQGMKEHLYDKRVVRRNLVRGDLDKASLQKHLENLRDVEDLIAPPSEEDSEIEE